MRWREDIWPPVMDDPTAAGLFGAVFPVVTAIHLFWLPGRFPDVADLQQAAPVALLLWAVSATLVARLIRRAQIFLHPRGHRTARVMAAINAPLAFALLWGTTVASNAQFVAGLALIHAVLFIGGGHPADRRSNAGWTLFAILLFFVLAGEA